MGVGRPGHEPPIRMEAALANAGIRFERGEEVELLNTRTGQVDLPRHLRQ